MGATIYNSELSRQIQDGAKIQVSRDKIPNELAEKVIPVMEVNPKIFRRIEATALGSATDATSATVLTTDSNKETYLKYVCLTISKDVVSDSTYTEVRCTPKGKGTSVIIRIRYEPLTAGSFTETIYFDNGILLEKGSVIQLINSTNTASIDSTAVVGYLEVLNPNS